ncbi:hypothetical protein Tco_0450115 [Tanacetum coccineum]
MLKHQSWSLKFAVYEALIPCRCGLVKHEDGDAKKGAHNNRHCCRVDSRRGYDDLISKYVVTAEEVCSGLIYKEHDSLHRHSNILEFYGREKFQNHSYFVFGEFESTMLDFISSGNVAEHLNVRGWIL